jgi:hypothetical protein
MQGSSNSTLQAQFAKNNIADRVLTTIDYEFEITKMTPENWKTVPVIINSYNRKTYLEELVYYLRNNGYENIYIIDNNSTYLPLLDFYVEKKLRVFYLSDNVGYLSLWQTSVFDYFIDEYYVLTDSDVVPVTDTPTDFIAAFANILDKYSFLDKVGFSLELEDLPNENPETIEIIKHEKDFWLYDINDEFYFSPIDTTFALYKPNAKGGWWLNSGRAKRPYIAKHLPWYENAKKLTDDDKYYYNSVKKSTHWSSKKRRGGLFKYIKSLTIGKIKRHFS